RIGGKRLDVAALALGVERVEGERALAGPRQAGNHDEPIARQLDRNMLQVVRARAANADGVQKRPSEKRNLLLYRASFSRRTAPLGPCSHARSRRQSG